MSSINLEKILADAKRLSGRLKEHDSTADTLLKQAHNLQKQVDSVKMYQENLADLQKQVKEQQQPTASGAVAAGPTAAVSAAGPTDGGAVSAAGPAAGGVVLAAGPAAFNAEAAAAGHLYTGSGLILENREIKQLTEENEELKQLLDDHQLTLELIMRKYRQRVYSLISDIQSNHSQPLPQIKNGTNGSNGSLNTLRICDMAEVMRQAISLDEEEEPRANEMIAQLQIENKAMKELLMISETYGSCRSRRDTSTQTEANKRAEHKQAEGPTSTGTHELSNRQKIRVSEANCNMNNSCDATYVSITSDIGRSITSETVKSKITTHNSTSNDFSSPIIGNSVDSKGNKVSNSKSNSPPSYSTTTIRRNRGKNMKAMLGTENEAFANQNEGSDVRPKAAGVENSCSATVTENSENLLIDNCDKSVSIEKPLSRSSESSSADESKNSTVTVNNMVSNYCTEIELNITNASSSVDKNSSDIDSTASDNSNFNKSRSEISTTSDKMTPEISTITSSSVDAAFSTLNYSGSVVSNNDVSPNVGDATQFVDGKLNFGKNGTLLSDSNDKIPFHISDKRGEATASKVGDSAVPMSSRDSSDSTAMSAIYNNDPAINKNIVSSVTDNIPQVEFNKKNTDNAQETVTSSENAAISRVNENKMDKVIAEMITSDSQHIISPKKVENTQKGDLTSSHFVDISDITSSESALDTQNDMTSSKCESVDSELSNCLDELDNCLSEEFTDDKDIDTNETEEVLAATTIGNIAPANVTAIVEAVANSTDSTTAMNANESATNVNDSPTNANDSATESIDATIETAAEFPAVDLPADAIVSNNVAAETIDGIYIVETTPPISSENVKDSKSTPVRNVKSATSLQSAKSLPQPSVSRPAAKSASATTVRFSPAANTSKAPIKPIPKAGSPAVNRSPGGPVKGSTPPRSAPAVKKVSSASADGGKTSTVVGGSTAKCTAAGSASKTQTAAAKATTSSATGCDATKIASPITSTTKLVASTVVDADTTKVVLPAATTSAAKSAASLVVGADGAKTISSANSSTAAKSGSDGAKVSTVTSPTSANKPIVSNPNDSGAKTPVAVSSPVAKSSGTAAVKSPLSSNGSKTMGKPTAAVCGTVRANAAAAKSPKS